MPDSSTKRLVVIGLLGTMLDRGTASNRWEAWRPTVALCQHEDLLVSRLELLRPARYTTLSDIVCRDIASVSPETTVKCHPVEFHDPWDFEEVYGALHDFVRNYPFDLEHERYAVHITTGTHVAQICLFLLTEAHDIPGVLLQTSPSTRGRKIRRGRIRSSISTSRATIKSPLGCTRKRRRAFPFSNRASRLATPPLMISSSTLKRSWSHRKTPSSSWDRLARESLNSRARFTN
jgi:hypothetical protein